MAETIRTAQYFKMNVPDWQGKGARALGTLRGERPSRRSCLNSMSLIRDCRLRWNQQPRHGSSLRQAMRCLS